MWALSLDHQPDETSTEHSFCGLEGDVRWSHDACLGDQELFSGSMPHIMLVHFDQSQSSVTQIVSMPERHGHFVSS
jgi:hypothetical protein